MNELTDEDLRKVNDDLIKRISKLEYWILTRPMVSGFRADMTRIMRRTNQVVEEARAYSAETNAIMAESLAKARDREDEANRRREDSLAFHVARTAILEAILAKVSPR